MLRRPVRTHRRTAVALPTLTAAVLGLATLGGPTASAAPAPSATPSASTGTAAPVSVRIPQVQATREADGTHTVTWTGKGRYWVHASTDAQAPRSSWREVGSANNGKLEVTGLRTDRRWYFRVDQDRSGRHGTVVGTRALDLDSVRNARDLGGYRTADGRSVAWGNLFRTEAMTAPTARDRAVLEGMGLVRSLEFRSAGEVAAKGPNQYPAGVQEDWAPLLDPSTDALSMAIQGALGGGDPSAVEDLLGDGKAWEIALTGPTKTSRSPLVHAAFGAALRQLADEGGVIFNCTAGKDRTGVFAAVLLRSLGVSEATVVQDYVLSNVYRQQYNEGTYQVLAAAGVDIELVRPLMEQQPEAMQNMFDAINAEYGSFEAWLDQELGVDAATVAKLRATLLV